MKKRMLVTLIVMILCLSATVTSAEELPWITGADSRANAVDLTVGTFYQSYLATNLNGNDVPHWFRVEAGEDTCTFYLNVINHGLARFDYHTETSIMIYDRNENQISKTVIDFGDAGTIPFSLEPFDYVTISLGKVWGGDVTFSLCSDNSHLVGKYSEISQAPTCTELGIRSYPCERCGISANTEEVAPLGHTLGDWTTETEPTCLTTGMMTIRCMTCNEIVSEKELEKLEHTSGKWSNVREPSCTTEGRQEQYCTVCNVLLDSTAVPARGHEMITKNIPASCTASGMNTMICSICGVLGESEEIPQLNHVPGSWAEEKKATCIADGLRVQYCSDCNAALNQEIITAFGHNAMEWQITREASCLECGLKEQKCSHCGVTLSSAMLDAFGHTYTEWVTITEATKEETGEKQRHCIGCGDTQSEIIPKIEKFLGVF